MEAVLRLMKRVYFFLTHPVVLSRVQKHKLYPSSESKNIPTTEQNVIVWQAATRQESFNRAFCRQHIVNNLIYCVHRKLNITWTTTENAAFVNFSRSRDLMPPFQIPIAQFDQSRTIRYQFK